MSWQIVPNILSQLIKDPDREKSQRVMAAMSRCGRSRSTSSKRLPRRREEDQMRKVIVNEFMSLDGVVQAPRRRRTRTEASGTAAGTWATGTTSGASGCSSTSRGRWLLLGRRTYEIFAGYWPNAPEDQQVIAEPLNTKPKFVATTTPLRSARVAELDGARGRSRGGRGRAQAGGRSGDLNVIGSAQLVRWLLEHDLVDELRLGDRPGVPRRRQGHLPGRRDAPAVAARRERGDVDRRNPRDLRQDGGLGAFASSRRRLKRSIRPPLASVRSRPV